MKYCKLGVNMKKIFVLFPTFLNESCNPTNIDLERRGKKKKKTNIIYMILTILSTKLLNLSKLNYL
jgi:hypothetical protein